MSFLEESIQNWIFNETNGLIDGRLKKLPDIISLSKLTEGKNKNIWKFVIKHVKSKHLVAFMKKLLEIRRAKKEREEFPNVDKSNIVILKNKLGKAEDKVHFIEHSLQSIKEHVLSLNTSLKNKKEENCILHQKCTLLELITMNLRGKTESVNVIIVKLYALLRKQFANDTTKCFEDIVDKKRSKLCIDKIKFSDDYLIDITNEITSIVSQKLLSDSLNLPEVDFVLTITDFMSYTSIVDVINFLKLMSQKDTDSIQGKVDKVKQKDVKKLSEIYLQSMKEAHLDSVFKRKKLESAKYIVDTDFSTDFGKQQKDYLTLHIQNECLAESTEYLEKQLTSEQNLTNELKDKNAKLKLQCQDVEIIMEDFYKKLKTLHSLSESLPQAFLSIKSSLESCRMFIDAEVLSAVKSNQNNCLVDVAGNIEGNYDAYLELLKSKDFLQDFFEVASFEKQTFPFEIWKFLGLETFQNPHFLIEKLASIKAKLSVNPKHFYCVQDDNPRSTADRNLSSIKDNAVKVEVVNKEFYDIKKRCKDLEIVLKDWWHQDAQYIPTIEHHKKTLKMWLAILNALE